MTDSSVVASISYVSILKIMKMSWSDYLMIKEKKKSHESKRLSSILNASD
jgi:uncharacterized membrane protein